MLRKIRGAQTLTLALAMLVLLMAANANAKVRENILSVVLSGIETVIATAEVQVLESPESITYSETLVDASKGGKIIIAEGVIFDVKANTLAEDTLIWAGMEVTADGLNFMFGPSGTKFVRNLKDTPAELSVTRQVLEGDKPGCIVASVTDPLKADLTFLYEGIENCKETLANEAELSESLEFVTSYLEGLIVRFQDSRNLEDFYREFQGAGWFVFSFGLLAMDLQDIEGLDEVARDLWGIVQTLSVDPLGDLRIYSEYYGEYIAAYTIYGDTVVWKIPHFSLYYFRRR